MDLGATGQRAEYRAIVSVMNRARPVLALVATVVVAGRATGQSNPVLGTTPSGHYPYTQADVQFVSGMIAHHAQAIVMAKWAPSHGASLPVRTLCARIINAQTDEITIMQRWLADRKQPVPDAAPMTMPMSGGDHQTLMPGMLTDSQLKELDAARGADFDRLFLRFMIQHHQGALTMVKDLFAARGAGQDEQVFKMANDIQADQSTEINRMTKMFFTTPEE
jgi:uncharacterized protein (DUF305 family)